MALSPLATAYARARGADRMSSFGDWVALSEPCDLSTAEFLRREVTDGIIAPGYDEGALQILSRKRGGNYCILEIDPSYVPDQIESRTVYGVHLEQRRNDAVIGPATFQDIVTRERPLSPEAIRDLTVATIALKYTQSNSVCLAYNGQVTGNGAGQQSRVHCTRLAATKSDLWFLRQHPVIEEFKFARGLSRADRNNAIDLFFGEDLSPAEERAWEAAFEVVPPRLSTQARREWLDQVTGVALSSDAYFPFRDSIDRASRSGVRYVAQPGGSMRDADVVAACDEYGMVMARTGLRLFHH